jgi:DNA polymerase-3 subunit gamma/tau
MMIVSIDPARMDEGEIGETERGRLTELAARFSREDLMRAFDVLSTAEQEIRIASQPRYHFEMVLLKWMHLRKLVPLTDLMQQLGAGSTPARLASSAPAAAGRPVGPPPGRQPVTAAPAPQPAEPQGGANPPASLKDALLAEIRSGKATFYNTVVAQAQRIEVGADRISFVFSSSQSALRQWFDQQRQWLEATAERLAGRKVAVVAVQADSAPTPPAPPAEAEPVKPRDLKAEALSSSAVQAMLDVFPAEIRDVEEM